MIFHPQADDRPICPVGRTMDPTTRQCIGDKCAVWRWRTLSAGDPAFQAAVKSRLTETKETHKEAVRFVMQNRERLGLPTEPVEGYCGLGGPPE